MREITPLTQNDCFTIFSRVKKEFSFPLHYHDEFELNFIMNAKGAKRIVGDNIEVIDDHGNGLDWPKSLSFLVYPSMQKRRNQRNYHSMA